MTCGQKPPGWSPARCCDGHLGDGCCQQLVAERNLGSLKRDAGLGRALMADPKWTNAALEEITVAAKEGEPFSADRIRRVVGAGPQGAMGAVFAAAAAQGLIRRTGDETSAASSRRRGRHGTWVGKDAPIQGHLHEPSDDRNTVPGGGNTVPSEEEPIGEAQ